MKRSLSLIGRRLVAALISMVVALGIGEFVVRLFAPQVLSVPVVDYVDGISTNLANIHGRQSTPGVYDVTYRTGPQRFRGTRDYAEQPMPGTIRIASIGDSFCFGIGVEDADTYPAFLERELQQRGYRVEVLNGGVGGTGTDTQALWYNQWVSRFHPNLVILSVLTNDIEEDQLSPLFTLDQAGNASPIPLDRRLQRVEVVSRARGRARMIPGYGFLAEHSHLLNLIRKVQSRALRPGGNFEAKAMEMAADRGPFVKQRLPLVMAELRWLKRHVDESGAKLVVAWYPMRELVYEEAGPVALEQRWRGMRTAEALAEFSAREGVPFFDASNVLKTRARGDRELYAWGGEYHPRPAAHRLFATELASFLVGHGLLGRSGVASATMSP